MSTARPDPDRREPVRLSELLRQGYRIEDLRRLPLIEYTALDGETCYDPQQIAEWLGGAP